MNTTLKYDVVIIGSGTAGSMLGAILSKNNIKTLILEKGVHPKFAIGESTIPQTSLMMSIMAKRYDIPEFAHMSSYQNISEHVSTTCGIKKNFGFVYHGNDGTQKENEANQVAAGDTFHSEAHLFRQDTDAFLLQVALKYGADVIQNIGVNKVDINKSGVEVETDRHTISAQYIVDGSGYNSLLANKFDLRDKPTRCKTHSRSMFTHMINVTPYDECIPDQYHGNPIKWSEGTLHHVFDGGWLWVIPFDNDHASKNKLCSVGLTLDPRKHPKPNISAKEEFANFIRKYPTIQKQFKNAVSVREWVNAGRIQYSSKKSTGYRFCLLSHSTGFIDPLFSRGLMNTTETVNALGDLLINCFHDNDFSLERFDKLETLQQQLIKTHDEIVNGSFISFKSYALWNTWYRIWALGSLMGVLRLYRTYSKYIETNDKSLFDALAEEPCPGAIAPSLPECVDLFNQAVKTIEEVDCNKLSDAQAEERIFAQLRDVNFAPPTYPFSDPNGRFSFNDPCLKTKIKDWVETQAPEHIRQTFFDYSIDITEMSNHQPMKVKVV